MSFEYDNTKFAIAFGMEGPSVDELSKGFRDLIIGVNTQVPLSNGEYVTAINLDNAATTPPFHSVVDEIVKFLPWYSAVHRGAGYKSALSSKIYEDGREIIKKFVNADRTRDVIIYTKNTTESINLLARILAQKDAGAVVLSTDMEHLANDLPWREQFKVDYACIDENGKLILEDLEAKLRKYAGKVKLVTVTGASNVTGYKNPIHQIASIAHYYGAEILVDGAQLVPHCPVDMKSYESSEHIDYLTFSAHKMYAPFGVGVLIGPRKLFENTEPVFQGGGAVRLVSHDFIDWESPPYNNEAGTPNLIGIVALLEAIKTLERIGMNVIHEYETNLLEYTIQALRCIPEVVLYGCTEKQEDKIGIIAFELQGIDHRLLSRILTSEAGISVRSGLFCAHPYVEKLLKLSDHDLQYYRNNPAIPFPGLVRSSVGLYNNYSEIDVFAQYLSWIAKTKNNSKQKYNKIVQRAQESDPLFLCPLGKKMP